MKLNVKILWHCWVLLLPAFLPAQDTVHYTGTTLASVDYHHGQLSPALGVHNVQTFRANRSNAAAE